MGFLDKLSKLADQITGGSAQVSVAALEPSRYDPFTVKVNAVVGEHDLQIKRVYVKVEGAETVVVRSVSVATEFGDEVKVSQEDVQQSQDTYSRETDIAGAQALKAGEGHEWEAQIQLPAGMLPTYQGPNAQHEWRILAVLDAPGNNPDSGWVTIEIL